ncbi:hypothetical protein JL107_01330 [Nakamurella flavida]|uniref:SLATT domain-containing protein n=1 Tax=Nakamurella flavida TaxID=363630 RepID=A0A938YKF7_9ACTN|nr:hypothetical protein [Nakamurella flavida]MBM9475077.1 hypothetical protein [Nakamurella flavida]MDP9776646.1 putative lysophospholipase L1 biosynthesis ABC-type transport system permease subunit [Nakamurella flavida]
MNEKHEELVAVGRAKLSSASGYFAVQTAMLGYLLDVGAGKLGGRERKFEPWKFLSHGTSVVGSLLTAVAGLAVLAKWFPESSALFWVPGAVALGAAFLTAVTTTVNPGRRVIRVGVERALWREFVLRVVSVIDQGASGRLDAPGLDREIAALRGRCRELELADAEQRA